MRKKERHGKPRMGIGQERTRRQRRNRAEKWVVNKDNDLINEGRELRYQRR